MADSEGGAPTGCHGPIKTSSVLEASGSIATPGSAPIAVAAALIRVVSDTTKRHRGCSCMGAAAAPADGKTTL